MNGNNEDFNRYENRLNELKDKVEEHVQKARQKCTVIKM